VLVLKKTLQMAEEVGMSASHRFAISESSGEGSSIMAITHVELVSVILHL
jgi:hypothetical protein